MGLPVELFFDQQNEAEALALCQQCPVRHECLAEAVMLSRKTDYPTEGVWGGLTEHQRSKLRGRYK